MSSVHPSVPARALGRRPRSPKLRFLLGLGLSALLLTGPIQAERSTFCCSAPTLHTSDCSQIADPPLPAAEVPEEFPEVAEAKPSYPKFSHQGQIQLQFDDGELGSVRPTIPFPAPNGLAPYPADSHLFVRRFRPSFDLEFSPQWDLETEFNIRPDREQIQVLDVRFNYKLGEQTALSLGRYKVPFGWEGLRSSRTTNTIERSDMTVALYPERDVGFSATHQQPKLGVFSLGTFLGQPRSKGGSNDHFDTIGRAVFDITDDLKIGVSGHLGSYRPAGISNNLPVRRLGTELQYENGPLQIEAEAIYSDGYNVASGIDSEAFGYYATVICRLTNSLDFVLNYDRFDPDLNASNPALAQTQTNARSRKVIGVNYYLDREQMHRIMLNYEIKQELEGADLYRGGVRLRYQLTW